MSDVVMFVIIGVVFTITAGSFFALIYWGNSKKPKMVIAILLAIAVGAGFSGTLALDKKCEDSYWNGGIHEKCGGHWELFDMDRTKHGHVLYYYQCDECNYVAEFDSQH